MVVLVSGATTDVSRYSPDRVGVLIQPHQGNDLARLELGTRIWAADNAVFSGFDAERFVRMLDRIRGIVGCRFVAAPDVVGDAPETLRLFDLWEPMIHSLGLPVALVAQDGLTVAEAPWARYEALFIGGSTAWKLSPAADTLLAYASAHGKWRHVGRVNSRRRLRHFRGRCDSIDGSGFSRWPKRIGWALQWMDADARAPRFQEVA